MKDVLSVQTCSFNARAKVMDEWAARLFRACQFWFIDYVTAGKSSNRMDSWFWNNILSSSVTYFRTHWTNFKMQLDNEVWLMIVHLSHYFGSCPNIYGSDCSLSTLYCSWCQQASVLWQILISSPLFLWTKGPWRTSLSTFPKWRGFARSVSRLLATGPSCNDLTVVVRKPFASAFKKHIPALPSCQSTACSHMTSLQKNKQTKKHTQDDTQMAALTPQTFFFASGNIPALSVRIKSHIPFLSALAKQLLNNCLPGTLLALCYDTLTPHFVKMRRKLE